MNTRRCLTQMLVTEVKGESRGPDPFTLGNVEVSLRASWPIFNFRPWEYAISICIDAPCTAARRCSLARNARRAAVLHAGLLVASCEYTSLSFQRRRYLV
jgi:hypothetical protein